MAFEPLQTDEKLSEAPKPTRDMDTQMMLGCTGFGVTAGLIFALVAWPHFVFADTYRFDVLAKAMALGGIPAMIQGLILSRKGLVGACGFVGGALVSTVFLYIRLQQVLLARYGDEAARPDYPAAFGWLVPVGFFLAAVAIALVALPKGALPDGDRSVR